MGPAWLCTSVGCINEWCKDRNLDPLYRLGVPLIQYFEEESDTAQHMKSEYDCEVCGIGQYTLCALNPKVLNATILVAHQSTDLTPF